MTAHDELLDNVAAYALGMLPPSEASAVADHLKSCKECREEYRLLRPAITAVAFSAEACDEPSSGATSASPLLKARIMKEVRAQAAGRNRTQYWPAYAVAAAALALAIFSGLLNLSLNARLSRDRAESIGAAQMMSD